MSRPGGNAPPKNTNPYINPFQHTDEQPERIDMGVDLAGTGPITAIGKSHVTQSGIGYSTGWDGPPQGGVYPGGFVEYTLDNGPAVNKHVYVAEGFTPTVNVGDRLKAGQKIGDQTGAIETGWGSNIGYSTLSQTPQGGGISGGGPFPTKLGINFDELLVGLGVKASPGIDSTGSGNLPPGFKKNYGTGKTSGGGSGTNKNKNKNPPTTTTSIFSTLGDLNNFFNLLTSADLWERIGLVLLGTIMVIIGILILVAPSANEKIGEALGIITKSKRLGGELGIGGNDTSGPSPEVQADRERRIALAERNASIGERKVQVMESKEGRLALGKPATKAKPHKSGNPEPNPAPTHS